MKSTPSALTFSPARIPADGDRRVFFASVDRSIPLVPGVTIVGLDSAQVVAIMNAALEYGVGWRRCRYADGRRAVVIESKEGA